MAEQVEVDFEDDRENLNFWLAEERAAESKRSLQRLLNMAGVDVSIPGVDVPEEEASAGGDLYAGMSDGTTTDTGGDGGSLYEEMAP